MNLELKNKVCVVTGASKGIGLAVTRALVAEGAIVVAGARTVDSLRGIESQHDYWAKRGYSCYDGI